MTTLRLLFTTEPTVLRIVRKQVAAAAAALGAQEYDVRRVELAVGEALNNAYLHAYDRHPGPLEVELAFQDSELAVAVHDEGAGLPFEPVSERPDRRIGNGYGFHVIKQLVDKLEIQHPGVKGRGTSVRLAVKLD